MTPVIKLRSKPSGTKPAAKKKAAAPAKGKQTTTRKPAAKKSTGRATAKKATKQDAPLRPKADARTIEKFERKLTTVGKKRDDTLKAHEQAVEDVFVTVQDAMQANVPMSVIARSVGVSRQWLYKMSTFKGRTNGSGPKKQARGAAKTASKGKTKPRPRVRSKA